MFSNVQFCVNPYGFNRTSLELDIYLHKDPSNFESIWKIVCIILISIAINKINGFFLFLILVTLDKI